MGNICRSPMAEAVFRHLVNQAGLAEQFHIDSVGTHSYHVGEPAHRGTRRVLQLCYGCHEWKFFGPGGMLLTDISEEAYFGPLTTQWLKKEGR